MQTSMLLTTTTSLITATLYLYTTTCTFTWQRKRVKRGEEDDNPCNDAVANAKWTGGLRPANNALNSTQLKLHGRKKITEAEMNC